MSSLLSCFSSSQLQLQLQVASSESLVAARQLPLGHWATETASSWVDNRVSQLPPKASLGPPSTGAWHVDHRERRLAMARADPYSYVLYCMCVVL
jgi:hypothetical protein